MTEVIAEKKKAILESTLQLVKEHGFHGTPMSLVAKKAGVAAGTIYHYFDSKDTLIMELFAYTQYRVQEAMEKDLRQGMEYREEFFQRWISRCKFYIQNPDMLFFIEQFVHSPYYPRCPKDQFERGQNEVLLFVETGLKLGELRDVAPRLMAIMIHGSVMTAAKIHLDKKILLGDPEFHQLANMVWDSIRKQ